MKISKIIYARQESVSTNWKFQYDENLKNWDEIPLSRVFLTTAELYTLRITTAPKLVCVIYTWEEKNIIYTNIKGFFSIAS